MARLLSSLLLLLILVGQSAPGLDLALATASSPPVSTEQAIRQTDLPWRDMEDLAARVKGVPREAAAFLAPPAAPERQEGDRAVFWVADDVNNRYFSVDAVLRVVMPHVYMYAAEDARVDTEKLRECARIFEEKTYAGDRRYFGDEPPTGLDGDPHVTILHASIPGVAGYFSSVDSYPRSVQPYSNERKMLYINVDAVEPGSAEYFGVLAHEFEHMIHWNTNRAEQTWIKEGAAEVATEAVGLASVGAVDAFEAKPDTQLNAWADSHGDVVPHYGAAYLFLSYFLERFGGHEAAADLLKGDTRGAETFDSFLSARGQGLTLEEVFKDWVVANYLDESGARDPRYRYDGLAVRVSPTDRVTSTTGWRDRTVHQFAADYLEVDGRWSSARIRFEGAPEARVVAVPAHSGSAFWWSNRGDLVDTKLTRIFDLRGLSQATLKFWAWYDLEDDYDYVYVMVSRDGGLTWSTLGTADTTASNPNGNNLGLGFTGKSGGEVAKWVQQTVDLSPYAGDVILVRFEQVTDDAYNAPGFALDDVEVPELGYRSDVEGDGGGWFADGFLRTDGRLDQRFALQLIRFGREITVEEIPLSPSGSADVELQNPDGRLEKAVLVVSGLTRYTTEPASYRYAVEMTP